MLRLIRRHGVFVAFAATTLALSVGANVAVFTIVNALWLKPSQFPDVDRLVTLAYDAAASTDAAFGSLESLDRWTIFEAVAGQVVTTGGLDGLRPRLAFDQVGREVETLGVTSQYFRLLGQAIRGRDFTRDDNRYGSEPVAIISDRLWSRAFERRVDVLGSVVAAKPFPVRIIGVAPRGFEGARRGEHADVWIPSNLVPSVASIGGPRALAEDGGNTMVFARLHPGQSPADAERRLVQDATDFVERRDRERIRVVPLSEVFGGPDSPTIVIREHGAAGVVAGLAALVLFAGCTTLMTLMLVHYERRRRELAIRTALGGARGRLAAELSRELAWVAASGVGAALLVAIWSLRALPALTLPGGVDLARLDLSLDWRVLAAGVAITVLTLTAAALLPVARFTHANLAGELVGAGSTSSTSSLRLRQALLGLHVVATIIVLVAAGLFLRTVTRGLASGSGFDVGRTVFAQVQVVYPFGSKQDIDARLAAIAEATRRVADAIRVLPGVDDVAIGPSPIGPDPVRSTLAAPKAVETHGGRSELRLGHLSGSPELLRVLGVPLLSGRELRAGDAMATPAGVVVTASLAHKLWGESDPIGEVVSVAPRKARYVVIGVADDFVFGSLSQPFTDVIVSVNKSERGFEPGFIVRTARPDLLVEPIRHAVAGVVPDAPRLVVETGRQIVARDLGRQLLGAWFFSGFGMVALVLGAGGVFGLVAYLAESRRREFGVRLTLGATPSDLLWRSVAAGLGPVSIGAAAGLVLAALVTRVFVAWLPGLSTLDVPTYTSVAVLMIGSATAAGFAGGWRLRRIAPADALKAE
jgi:putative ABC transport system permease protein